MIIGAILQASSFSYAQMVVARIVTGFGNGLNVGRLLVSPLAFDAHIISIQTSTVPAYHAECSAAEHRGAYIMIEGSLITFGIMVS